jgi:hypothetical protein
MMMKRTFGSCSLEKKLENGFIFEEENGTPCPVLERKNISCTFELFVK